ncbi:MAG: ATP-binding protein [candidate division NC10 bacterium]|nr:ATP-binding protein [candidate division NC10 bacterium]
MRRYQGAPLYLLLLCGLVLFLLCTNSLLEFRRTQQGLYKILEGQGAAYLDSQEREVRAIATQIAALKEDQHPANPSLPLPYGDLLSLDSAITEHLLDVALSLDRQEREGRLDPDQISSLMKAEKLSRIEFRDRSGNLRFGQGEGKPSSKGAVFKALLEEGKTVFLDDFLAGASLRPHYLLGMKRRYGQGLLLLSLTGSQMQSLRLRWLLEGSQGVASPESGLRYLILQGEDLISLSSGQPLDMEEDEKDPFLMQVRKGKTYRSRIIKIPSGDEVYEVVKPFSLDQQEIALLRVGLSLQPTRTLLSQLKASILIQLSLSLAFALIATLAIFWMQNRHLLRLKEMEEKVEISERLSSLGQLAAGLAHEIRNPLNAISMGIQRLRREFAESLSAQEARDLLQVISSEIRRLDSLVERFLGLARPERVVRGEGDLGKILSQLLQLFAVEARERGIEIKSSIPSVLPSIPMDAEGIKQAFLNLIKNAMEAMEGACPATERHGGSLQVEAHPLDRQWVQITISDSGCGIPAPEQHKIFDPYYTTKKQGMGLGLSLAYQIIKAHGGQIEIQSEEGRGTQVRVMLPVGDSDRKRGGSGINEGA